MKRKYRIIKILDFDCKTEGLAVQVWNFFWWITVKSFFDEDMDFNKREAEELLEKLEEK